MATQWNMELRVRTNCFLGICAVGVLAGLVGGVYGGAPQGLFVSAVMGVFQVLLAGYAGSFAGMIGAGAYMWMRYRKGAEYGADGVLLLSAFGGFLGVVAGLVFAPWADAASWAAVGAFLGGAVAGASAGAAGSLFDLLVLDAMSPEFRHRALARRMPSVRLNPDAMPPQRPPEDDDSSSS
ncbi:hypothetical protein GGQ74_000953 [Desulfobaculum xiamenense]|uniref:Uncharacterized protein n=1 Tax=Desulfobaculum xiamenense TaxID=995050 RepID=A0A846QM64_9BACT|nr:hypothetical protein [Desulfobaculum xiamenense]NJB67313.1 hypothetical protein [Desulfobaculum xiamenense]